MSEYVTVEAIPTDDPDRMELEINQMLTEEKIETYTSYDEGDEGSPLAQMLFNGVEGIVALTITPHSLFITRESDAPWEQIIDDVRDAIRDFYL